MAGAIFFIGIATLLIVVAYLSYYLKKKRRDELAMMARQLGLTYSRQDVEGLIGYPFQ